MVQISSVGVENVMVWAASYIGHSSKHFAIFNLGLPWGSMRPFPLVLSIITQKKRSIPHPNTISFWVFVESDKVYFEPLFSSLNKSSSLSCPSHNLCCRHSTSSSLDPTHIKGRLSVDVIPHISCSQNLCALLTCLILMTNLGRLMHNQKSCQLSHFCGLIEQV